MNYKVNHIQTTHSFTVDTYVVSAAYKTNPDTSDCWVYSITPEVAEEQRAKIITAIQKYLKDM